MVTQSPSDDEAPAASSPARRPSLPSGAEARAIVQRFWALYQARRWADAQALLAPHAECLWWATQERFRGGEAIVHVNAVYPEGWTIHLIDLQTLMDGRVLSLVRVEQDGSNFYANSYFHVRDGLIQQIDEYWSDQQPAPAWRCDPQAPLPGRAAMPVDRRQGLPLQLPAGAAPSELPARPRHPDDIG